MKPRLNKGQVWGLDAMIASALFSAGIVILFVYSINYTGQTGGDFEELYFEAFALSEYILDDSGFGILENGRINETKTESFYNLSYESQKDTAGILHEFYFVIPELTLQGENITHIGKLNDTTTKNLASVERVSVYNNTVVVVTFYVWN